MPMIAAAARRGVEVRLVERALPPAPRCRARTPTLRAAMADASAIAQICFSVRPGAPVGRQHGPEVQLQVACVVRAASHRECASERSRRGSMAPHAAFSVSSPFFQLQGHSSSVCSASSTRSTSSGLRPTFRSVTYTKRMTPCGSTMKVARCATPASGSRMPSAVRELALDVREHRERQVLQLVLAPGATRGARTRCRCSRRAAARRAP